MSRSRSWESAKTVCGRWSSGLIDASRAFSGHCHCEMACLRTWLASSYTTTYSGVLLGIDFKEGLCTLFGLALLPSSSRWFISYINAEVMERNEKINKKTFYINYACSRAALAKYYYYLIRKMYSINFINGRTEGIRWRQLTY